ncbi:DUF1127 domain-containing protein [Pikeienuella sp. HZG-20]|uniref:DUF1127 domain-containing protein n=1 Tax=Paludibacillus litoralis TaxID=3133267 RepID=UPI0030EBE113
MAYLQTSTAPCPEIGLAAHFHKLVARINAWRSYRATVRALSALSDAELKDIGLTRDQIIGVSRRSL